MKFSSLHLLQIPRKGLIGIEGPNESGKSTIGDAVLFALFGKTRTSMETSVSRLIHWGADFLNVELEFEVSGRGEYLIYREIDKYGTNYVKVIDLDTRVEMAAGNVNVSEFIRRTLRFDFLEFQQSFYHDQVQESQPRGGQPAFVERITGIAHVQEAVQGLKKEIDGLERQFSHYQKDIGRNLQQIEKYEHNVGKIPGLREQRQDCEGELERLRTEQQHKQEEEKNFEALGERRMEAARRIESLSEKPASEILTGLEAVQSRLESRPTLSPAERAFQDSHGDTLKAHQERQSSVLRMIKEFQDLQQACQELLGNLKDCLDPASGDSLVSKAEKLEKRLGQTQKSARFAGLVAIVLFVLAVLSGGTAAAIFAEMLPEFSPWDLGPESVLWIAAGTGLFFLFVAAIFLARRRGVVRRTRELEKLWQEQEGEIRLASEERALLSPLLLVSGPGEVVRFMQGVERISDPSITAMREKFLAVHGALVNPEGDDEYRKLLLALSRQERDFHNSAHREGQKVEKSLQDFESVLKKASGSLARVENEIRECESQAAKRDTLLKRNEGLQSRAREIRDTMEIRRLAIRLLDETSSSIRNKFGPAISQFLKDLFPRLTRGRYRDIKVASDLSLQIFTSDKMDFLDPAELSGGTHEALALALRLATSQVFVSSRTRQKQFVFLDEPFRMMDENRTLDAITVLPELSEDLPQIFLIQPNFTTQQREVFHWVVQTELGSSRLHYPPGAQEENGEAGPSSKPGVKAVPRPSPHPTSETLNS